MQSARRGHVFHTFSYSHRKWVVYFVVMMILRHAPARCMARALNVCALNISYLRLRSTQYWLYCFAINVIFAYGAVPPKVIGLRRGHPGELHIIAYFQIWDENNSYISNNQDSSTTYFKLLVVMSPTWFFRGNCDLSSSCSKILKMLQTQNVPNWRYNLGHNSKTIANWRTGLVLLNRVREEC